MADAFHEKGDDSLKRLLSDIEQYVLTQQALFGDILPIEKPDNKQEPPMPATKPQAEELLLFDLPSTGVSTKPKEQWDSATTLEELNSQICTCVKCPLGHTRTKFVFGVGNPHATLMLIGEAPGVDEDMQGEPFVGRAGQLLNKILEAIKFRREEVYICNILKCRPPNNRSPQPEEVDLCIPYLRKQIEIIQPKLILCLGLVAAENLLGTRESLTRLRGQVLSYNGIPVMVTYHPAALLRNPQWKRPAWEDVQAVRKLHDKLTGKGE
jgi:DNA polymerase